MPQVEMSSKKGQKQLVILAFPSNDFHQEPGTNADIKRKVAELLGDDMFDNPYFVLFQESSLKENPIYESLHKSFPNNEVKHNFFKYIVDSYGSPLSFHTKKETLLDIEQDIIQTM